MALLDVSFLLTDPDLADPFTVRRRREIVGTNGRNSFAASEFPAIGVITSISPNDLQRKEDYQMMPRSISVVTKFRLRGVVEGGQPDIVVWKGSNYIVRYVDQYPHFGQGFIQAECTSMDKVDVDLLAGQLIFNVAANTCYLPLLG